MADRKPIKVLPDGGGDSAGLAEFVAADTIGVVDGGTGLATVAASNILTGNGTSALSAESNLTFDGSTLAITGSMTLSSTSTISGDMTFGDNVKVTLGTGGDADIYYDATNLIINPAVAGSGTATVLGNVVIQNDTHGADQLLRFNAENDAGNEKAVELQFDPDASTLAITDTAGTDFFTVSTATGNVTIDGSGQSTGVITNLTIKDGDANPVILTSQQVSSKAVMGFTVGGSQRAQINSDGNVGIGTTAPGYPLDVQGTVAGMFHTKTVHGSVTGLNEVKTFASSSPADGDLPWQMVVYSKDSAGSSVVFGQFAVFSSDLNSSARSSYMRFVAYNGGSAYLASLSSTGVWTDASGEAGKEYEGTRQEVWPDGILSKIKNLRVSKYHGAHHPKNKPITETHVSPTAEDFWDALGIGEDPRAEVKNKDNEKINSPGIAAKDLAGVALVAVQELLERVEALEAA